MERKRKWPWFGKQGWKNVLFIHWPVPYEELRAQIPKPFKLDTYNGVAWVGIVLLEATNSRIRGFSRSMSYRSFLQLNARTYVKFDEEPGVYFFTLDASSKLAVLMAKSLFSQPYFHANMKVKKKADWFFFESNRIKRNGSNASVSAIYQPDSNPFYPEKSTLPYWLTERYCIWTIKGKKILKGPISHQQWSLQDAKVDIEKEGLFPLLSNSHFQENPVVHYSKFMNAHLHPFELIGIQHNR